LAVVLDGPRGAELVADVPEEHVVETPHHSRRLVLQGR
jgi:hypothetical protein